MKDSILKYLGQIILIVFSVVLGLYLSERIEDRKNEKDANKLFSKIKSELNQNREILDYWVPYHLEIIKSVDSLSKDKDFVENFIKDKSLIYEAFTRGTIMKDIPSSDAWDIAKSHPLIVNLDYDKLLILSKIYNQQELTYESTPKIIDLIVSSEFNAKESAKSNLQLLGDKLYEVYGRETLLLEYYQQAENL